MSQSLVVVPTEETLQRLRRIMMAAPFQLDWDKMVVEITQTDGVGQWRGSEDPNTVYSDIKVLHLTPKQAYLPGDDSGVPSRILVAACGSNQLRVRAAHAGDAGHGVEDAVFNWIMASDVQESRAVRVFLANLGNMLATEDAFSFTGECTVEH